MSTAACAFACVVAVLALANGANAEPLALEEERAPALVNALGYAEEIVEARATGSASDLPLHLRLFRISAPGECDGAPETCPTQLLYLVVSPLGEDETPRLFRLPDAHGWEFISWSDTTTEDNGAAMIGILDRRIVGPDPETGWWSTQRYELRLTASGNAISAALQPVE